MATDVNDALAAVMLNAYATAMPSGSILELRTGARAGANSPAAGTLLASCTSAGFAAPSGSAMQKSGVWTGLSVATGVIGHGRFRDAASTYVEELTVTASGGGGDVTVNDLTVGSVGMTVTANTFTKRLP